MKDFETILTISRSWPFVDQWKILKAMVDTADKDLFDALYRYLEPSFQLEFERRDHFSTFHSLSTQDFILSARNTYKDNDFWMLSTELSRKKAQWLENPITRRKYHQIREKSAYLTNRQDIELFPFINEQLRHQAFKITQS